MSYDHSTVDGIDQVKFTLHWPRDEITICYLCTPHAESKYSITLGLPENCYQCYPCGSATERTDWQIQFCKCIPGFHPCSLCCLPGFYLVFGRKVVVGMGPEGGCIPQAPSLTPRPHPLIGKRVLWRLSNFLVVLSQQSQFQWDCTMSSKCLYKPMK